MTVPANIASSRDEERVQQEQPLFVSVQAHRSMQPLHSQVQTQQLLDL